MKKIQILLIVCVLYSCNTATKNAVPNKELHTIFNNYFEENIKLNPFFATSIGDKRYNNQFPINITDSFRDVQKAFFEKYLTSLQSINANSLNENDKISYDLLVYDLQLSKDGLQFPSNLTPINQFWSFTNEFPQLGSGEGNQPFKTVEDYDNFTARIKIFPLYVSALIENMRKGIAQGYVLPKTLAEKMVPQFKAVLTIDPTKSIFYTPILNFPNSFTKEDKKRLENAYFYNISNSIIPAYSKLRKFVETEYIPACRTTSGISSTPNGASYYQYLIKNYTTTNLTPDSIYNLGLREVARIKTEMEKVKEEVKFSGNLKSFFDYMNKDKQFYPFTIAQQVLDSFWSVKKTEDIYLNKLFSTTPKTKFEIRQTEAFRAASASAEYNAGSEDGSRPGIFYTPILDAKKFNAIGMETLFLHEAIPGHHYQISLQQENNELPKFRKFLGYSAYAEGWALYTETLGKELGLYKNPYQYFGHLSDAMHRAIRLVVDVAIHTKGMSREEAIKYMMDNERISEAEATAEIERYMAIPGQALSYKIGQLTISAMKEKYQKKLGGKFDIRAFHNELLNGGNMPLDVLEKKLERWAEDL